jgi:iron complex outermembrane receptor protein
MLFSYITHRRARTLDYVSHKSHWGIFMRLSAVAAISCFMFASLSVAQHAAAAIRKETHISAQPLGSALEAFARDRNLQLIYATDEVGSLRSDGAAGNLSMGEALKRLLKGTGLSYEFLDDHTVTVQPVGSGAGARLALPSSQVLSASAHSDSLWDRFRVAEADQGGQTVAVSSGGGSASSADVSKSDDRLSEIIVTAQKRSERLQDVPVSVSVLNPQDLELNGQKSLIDYFADVPGLSISHNAYWGGTNLIVIRGISAGYNQNPTTATVIDDVPVTASLSRNWGNLTSPDLDPSDLAQIEVLKGPQGTLYGADSLSGLVKYVTNDPSMTKLTGRVEVSGSDIPIGGAGYGVRGAVNVPVSDTFAFRLSAFDRHDPGYIDNLSVGQKNFDYQDVFGGHVAALWRPSANFSLKLSALVQGSHGNIAQVDSDFQGNPYMGQFNYVSLPGTNGYSTQAQLYSATVDWKVAGMEVSSITGYVVNEFHNGYDVTGILGIYAYACEQYPQQNANNCGQITGMPQGSLNVAADEGIITRKVSQELRVGSSIGKWLDWRLGGFYTHEGSPGANQLTDLIENNAGAYLNTLYNVHDITMSFSEYAVFGDLTTHINDRFDIEAGAREAWNKQAERFVDSGIGTDLIDLTPGPDTSPLNTASGSAFTYQVTPRLKLSPDLMTYVRIATGYRIGGYNATGFLPSDAPLNIPKQYAPDRTTNYEIGVKYDGLEHRLSLSAAAYHISWKDFQLGVATTNAFVFYTANAGNAKSDGIEFSLAAHPWWGFTASLQGSLNNAILTQGLPADERNGYVALNFGAKGTQLPYSLRHSYGLSLNQDVHLTAEWTGFAGLSADYVGARSSEFAGGPPPSVRSVFPSYVPINMHVGARTENLQVNVYVNNVADRRGIIGIIGGTSSESPSGAYTSYIPPRTIGVSLSRTF